MQKKSFNQGFLDSMCGIYSVVNADRIVNNSTKEQSQKVFNDIIELLSRKRKLKEVVIGGVDHKIMQVIFSGIDQSIFAHVATNKKGILSVKDWWEYSKSFLDEKNNRCIILSIGGYENHITVAHAMTDKMIFLTDSGGYKFIRKSSIKLQGYLKDNKRIIYPSQCWYLGRD